MSESWVYYPKTCAAEDGECKLVVVLHGNYARGRDLALPTAGWV